MKRLSRNALAIGASDLLRRLLGFAAVTYLARKVGAAGFGAVNVGFTVLSYALMAGTAGLNTYGTRSVARGEPPSVVSRVLTLRVLQGIIVGALMAAGAMLFISDEQTSRLIVIFSLSPVVNAFMLDWFFQGREEMGIIGAARAFSAAAYLGFILLLVHGSSDIVLVAAAAVGADTAAVLVLIILFSRRNPRVGPVRFDLGGWRRLLRDSLHLGGGSILAHIGVNLPPLVIGILMSNSDVGIYSAAGKLVVVLLVADRLAGMLLLPAAARLHSLSIARLTEVLGTAQRWIVIAALPVTFGGMILSGSIVPFIYGAEYAGAIPVVRILIWFFFFTMLHTVYATGLIAFGREGSFSRLMLIGAGLSAVTVPAGTAAFGPAGAAAGVVVSEAVTAFLVRRSLVRSTPLALPPSLLNAVAAAVLMAAGLLFIGQVHLIVAVVLGGLAYLILLFLFRAVNMADLSELFRRLSW